LNANPCNESETNLIPLTVSALPSSIAIDWAIFIVFLIYQKKKSSASTQRSAVGHMRLPSIEKEKKVDRYTWRPFIGNSASSSLPLSLIAISRFEVWAARWVNSAQMVRRAAWLSSG